MLRLSRPLSKSSVAGFSMKNEYVYINIIQNVLSDKSTCFLTQEKLIANYFTCDEKANIIRYYEKRVSYILFSEVKFKGRARYYFNWYGQAYSFPHKIFVDVIY